MDEGILTGLIVAGNILATNLVAIGTQALSANYVKDERARKVINIIVPTVTAVGIGAFSSGIIADAWSTDTEIDTEIMDDETATDVETVDQAAIV